MKRGYLWVDWVELGCRGWDIDETGAQLLSGDDEYAYAHLDRTTLDIATAGSRHFLAQAINDLGAAGLFVRRAPAPIESWALPHTLTAGTTAADTSITMLPWSVNVSGWGDETDNGMVWTHPSGATLTLKDPPKPEGRFARWLRTARSAYLAAILESFYRWFQQAQKFSRETEKLRKIA